jgi:hypothetical protein
MRDGSAMSVAGPVNRLEGWRMNNVVDYVLLVFVLSFLAMWVSVRIGASYRLLPLGCYPANDSRQIALKIHRHLSLKITAA